MSDKTRELYAEIGTMVAQWNGLEWSLLEVLEELTKDKEFAHVVGSQMGSAAQGQTLIALARDRLPESLSGHVARAVAVFERLRTYRNQFVHRVTAVIPSEDGAVAFTYGVRSAGKLMRDQGELSSAQLSVLQEQGRELSHYLTWLKLHIRWHRDPADMPPRAFRGEAEFMPLPAELPSRWVEWT